MPLKWIPANYGGWFVNIGFQWFDVINSAQKSDNAFSICLSVTCSSGATSSVWVAFAGLGVVF